MSEFPRFSALPEETARLDAKIRECRRLNWKLLGMSGPPVEYYVPPSDTTSMYSGLQFNDMKPEFANRVREDGVRTDGKGFLFQQRDDAAEAIARQEAMTRRIAAVNWPPNGPGGIGNPWHALNPPWRGDDTA